MLVNNLAVSGGYQKTTLRLSTELTKKGHDVIIYTLKVDPARCYPSLLKDCKIVSVNAGKELFDPASKTREFEKLAQLLDENLDAVIVHDDLCLSCLRFFRSRNRSAKCIWYLNNQLPSEFTIDHKRLLLQSLRKYEGIKVVLRELLSLLRLMRTKRRMKGNLRYVDVIAVYDHFNGKLVETHLRREATVVYAGADVDRFSTLLSGRVYGRKEVYKILSVGVIFPHRRYSDLIRAVKMLLNDNYKVSATIVGLPDFHPEYYRNLLSLTEALDLKRHISFRDHVTDGEMLKLFMESDIFVFVNDGFTWGISVFEAIASGLPIVITNNIGAADIIRNGIDGWVVKPRDPLAIAQAIKSIIDDPDQVARVTSSAFDHTAQIVSWEAFAQRIFDLLTTSTLNRQ
jgi:glycosyltransferase involved in cell wall biosynthesis